MQCFCGKFNHSLSVRWLAKLQYSKKHSSTPATPHLVNGHYLTQRTLQLGQLGGWGVVGNMDWLCPQYWEDWRHRRYPLPEPGSTYTSPGLWHLYRNLRQEIYESILQFLVIISDTAPLCRDTGKEGTSRSLHTVSLERELTVSHPVTEGVSSYWEGQTGFSVLYP